MISNSGHDERGKYSGGKAGDQTGTEWQIRPWYNRPWTHVLRHPSASVRATLAALAEEAADNDKIGYDQNQRTTFWTRLKEAGYHPAKITSPCEADCSAGVAAIVKAAGYLLSIRPLMVVSPDMYTGNERQILTGAGFQCLTDEKYLAGEDYLHRGDILLCEGHHTCVNLTDGLYVKDEGWRWILEAGLWYYQNNAGTNKHGWALIKESAGTSSHWYYFNLKGQMQTGWQEIEGRWYYFEPSGPLEGALYRSDEKGAQSVWYV